MTDARTSSAGLSASRDLGPPKRKPFPPIAVLRAFEAVGRLGGVRRAAAALGLDHAVVSRHVRWLEVWSGVRLFERLQVGGCLTSAGAAYHARIAGALAEIASASAELTCSSRDSQLDIWCVPGFASQWLFSRLQRFRESSPAFQIEVHPADVPPDFSRCEADADVRYIPLGQLGQAVTGARGIEIARPPVFPVASPQLLRKFPEIENITSLPASPLLHEANQEEWKTWLTLNGLTVRGSLPGPKLWHAYMALGAASRGEGVALANPFLLGEEITSGRLIKLRVGKPTILGAYVLFCRNDRAESPVMRKFRSWLLRQTAISKERCCGF